MQKYNLISRPPQNGACVLDFGPQFLPRRADDSCPVVSFVSPCTLPRTERIMFMKYMLFALKMHSNRSFQFFSSGATCLTTSGIFETVHSTILPFALQEHRRRGRIVTLRSRSSTHAPFWGGVAIQSSFSDHFLKPRRTVGRRDEKKRESDQSRVNLPSHTAAARSWATGNRRRNVTGMVPCTGTGLMTSWCAMAARLGLTTSPGVTGSYPREKLLQALPPSPLLRATPGAASHGRGAVRRGGEGGGGPAEQQPVRPARRGARGSRGHGDGVGGGADSARRGRRQPQGPAADCAGVAQPGGKQREACARQHSAFSPPHAGRGGNAQVVGGVAIERKRGRRASGAGAAPPAPDDVCTGSSRPPPRAQCDVARPKRGDRPRTAAALTSTGPSLSEKRGVKPTIQFGPPTVMRLPYVPLRLLFGAVAGPTSENHGMCHGFN